MKSIYLAFICLLFILPCLLMAQQTNEVAQLLGVQFTKNDTLTSSYSGFVHTNWTQAGIGVSIKRVLLMYNTTVLPTRKNYMADRTMDYVVTQTPMPTWDINYKYDVIMIGYILRMTRNLYPYVGTGTVVKTEMIEVTEAGSSGDVYTVKGKDETFATGIVGAIYTLPHHVTIEGSLQINPLLPFIGVGIRL